MRDYERLRKAAHAVIDEVWCPECGYDSVWNLRSVLAEASPTSEMERLVKWLKRQSKNEYEVMGLPALCDKTERTIAKGSKVAYETTLSYIRTLGYGKEQDGREGTPENHA